MEDEEMMNVDSLFCEWFRKQNIEDVGIKELAGNAYFEGYEKAKKELMEQIEKMKYCGNCKYFYFEHGIGICEKEAKRNIYYRDVCDKWELAE